MSQQEQIEQLQGQVMELRTIVNQLVGPAGEFLFKRDTTLGIKDTKIVLGAGGSRVGFFGTAPVAQPSSVGDTSMTPQPAGTNVAHTNTWTGNTGSTGYTIGDIVKHLKELGILAP